MEGPNFLSKHRSNIQRLKATYGLTASIETDQSETIKGDTIKEQLKEIGDTYKVSDSNSDFMTSMRQKYSPPKSSPPKEENIRESSPDLGAIFARFGKRTPIELEDEPPTSMPCNNETHQDEDDFDEYISKFKKRYFG